MQQGWTRWVVVGRRDEGGGGTGFGGVHLELLDGEGRLERHVVVALVKGDPVLLARAAEEDLLRVDRARVHREDARLACANATSVGARARAYTWRARTRLQLPISARARARATARADEPKATRRGFSGPSSSEPAFSIFQFCFSQFLPSSLLRYTKFFVDRTKTVCEQRQQVPSDTVYLGVGWQRRGSCGARTFFSLPTHWISATGLSIFVCARARKGELPADLLLAHAATRARFAGAPR